MNPETQKALLAIGTSDQGKVFKEYLDERLIILKGDIDLVDSWEDVLARRKAAKLIKDIFSFLEGKQEKIIKKPSNEYM